MTPLGECATAVTLVRSRTGSRNAAASPSAICMFPPATVWVGRSLMPPVAVKISSTSRSPGSYALLICARVLSAAAIGPGWSRSASSTVCPLRRSPARRSNAVFTSALVTVSPPRGSRLAYSIPLSYNSSPNRFTRPATSLLPRSTNSAPRSTVPSPWNCSDHTRPPTRSVASSTVTSIPSCVSASAAVRPARPAPITITLMGASSRAPAGPSSRHVDRAGRRCFR